MKEKKIRAVQSNGRVEKVSIAHISVKLQSSSNQLPPPSSARDYTTARPSWRVRERTRKTVKERGEVVAAHEAFSRRRCAAGAISSAAKSTFDGSTPGALIRLRDT